MPRQLKVGLIGSFNFPLMSPPSFKDLIQVAQVAEEAGFDAIFFNDHFVTFPEPTRNNVFDCWTAMAAIATNTYRIRLGTLVSPIGYRHPAVLAKIVTTLDYASGGRVIFGIGAGWYDVEYQMFGITYPPPRERIERMKEAIEYIQMLWTEDIANYNGKYFKLKNAIFEPKPLQKPFPPLLVGGSGRKKTLRIVAEHADASNFSGSVENVNELNDLLDKYIEEVGRNPSDVLRTVNLLIHIDETTDRAVLKAKLYKNNHPRKHVREMSWEEYQKDRLIGTPEQVLEQIENYIEAGMEYAIFIIPDMFDDKILRFIGDEIIDNF